MKTKEYMAYSLIDLMKTKDFETITIKEITKNAHVNRSTYYRNFKSKEDILKFQLRKITEEYINKFESVEEKTEKNHIYTILNTYNEHRVFFLTIQESKQLYILQQVYLDYLQDNIHITSSKEELYKLYHNIGGVYNFIICWIENGMDENLEELTELYLNIISDKEKGQLYSSLST